MGLRLLRRRRTAGHLRCLSSTRHGRRGSPGRRVARRLRLRHVRPAGSGHEPRLLAGQRVHRPLDGRRRRSRRDRFPNGHGPPPVARSGPWQWGQLAGPGPGRALSNVEGPGRHRARGSPQHRQRPVRPERYAAAAGLPRYPRFALRRRPEAGRLPQRSRWGDAAHQRMDLRPNREAQPEASRLARSDDSPGACERHLPEGALAGPLHCEPDRRRALRAARRQHGERADHGRLDRRAICRRRRLAGRRAALCRRLAGHDDRRAFRSPRSWTR
jgi:hypothetical protein